MPREKITFQLGTQVLVEIDGEGVCKPGSGYNGADEYQYICGRNTQIMWVPAEAAAQIEDARQFANEVAITKQKGKGKGSPVTWEVLPVQDDTAYQEPASPQRPAPAPPPPAAAPRPAPPPPAPPASGRRELLPVPPIPAPTLLIESIYLAIHAAANAERFAAQVLNRTLEFSAEDIRALAITQYITGTKGGR
jgi:hypothetical protein